MGQGVGRTGELLEVAATAPLGCFLEGVDSADLVELPEPAIGCLIRDLVGLGGSTDLGRGVRGHLFEIGEDPQDGPSQVVDLGSDPLQDLFVVLWSTNDITAGVVTRGWHVPGEQIEPLGEGVENCFVDLEACRCRLCCHVIPLCHGCGESS